MSYRGTLDLVHHEAFASRSLCSNNDAVLEVLKLCHRCLVVLDSENYNVHQQRCWLHFIQVLAPCTPICWSHVHFLHSFIFFFLLLAGYKQYRINLQVRPSAMSPVYVLYLMPVSPSSWRAANNIELFPSKYNVSHLVPNLDEKLPNTPLGEVQK